MEGALRSGHMLLKPCMSQVRHRQTILNVGELLLSGITVNKLATQLDLRSMRPLPKLNAIPVFRDVQQELITLLKGLSEEEWHAPTRSTAWNVKDVAAHLLDGDLRRLSLHRDKLTLPDPDEQIRDYASLVDYLNKLNNTWITASKRLSPKLLIELTKFTFPLVMEHLKTLDPEEQALFPVDWAGEKESTNRFDIAREYTEKWHHQQQIREATGRKLLTGRKWLYPLVETLIRAVPAVYDRHVPKASNRTITIYISGVVDDSWLLKGSKEGWNLFKSDGFDTDASIRMDDETAWKLFSKAISEEEALDRLVTDGDPKLTNPIAKTTSFMK